MFHKHEHLSCRTRYRVSDFLIPSSFEFFFSLFVRAMRAVRQRTEVDPSWTVAP